MGNLDYLTHHGPNLGEVTTFPHIVFSAVLRRSYIQMAFFPKTPKWESRNCPELESWDFGRPYLFAPNLDRNESSTKVVALVEKFPTLCCTLSGHVEKRSIIDF
jgi:hypothetical protein